MREKLIVTGELAGALSFVTGAFLVSFGTGLMAAGAVVFGASRVADQ